ncbi:MAG: gliding motility protein GldL [Tannerella sp.]|jgi:gliding motility-associated protein GldL|nr:gliding motility protein GldL [Tannerella sp.]
MGKYRRYKNRVEMFLSSERGKRVLNFCYSWGASVIVIGAMFKIVHLPYANTILCVSLIFESLVFFISAFERPNSEYNWEEVFPVLKSKNPLDRPDFVTGGAGGAVIVGDGAANLGGSTVVIGNLGGAQGAASGMEGEGRVANGSSAGGGVSYAQTQSPQNLVNAGMATMGLNISEKDSEVLAESIKKLNSAAEQISKMADLTEATQTYIDQMSTVSHNLEKFNEITGSLGDVSDTLISSCKAISGATEDGTEESPKSYVENMSKLNENLSGLNHFYENQLSGLRSQMDTIQHINAGLNRIRDMYDSSIVDSAAFRNENERMAQLLSQLNQVYGRLLQAMTVNMQAGGYPPAPAAGSPGYQQPPYQGYPPQGGYR